MSRFCFDNNRNASLLPTDWTRRRSRVRNAVTATDIATWNVTKWADATGTITQAPGFNLGGIVVSPDQRSLIVAQGNVGALWSFDLAPHRNTDRHRRR